MVHRTLSWHRSVVGRTESDATPNPRVLSGKGRARRSATAPPSPAFVPGGLVLAAVLALGMTGCGEQLPLEVREGSTADLELAAAQSPFAVPGTGRQILMLDACDPESFNEAFGFEVCTPVHRQGGIPFSTFIDLLEKHQRVDAWRFAPEVIHVPRTTTLRVVNAGGIPHTLTEVEEFGPGIIPLLNELSGNPGDPVPECLVDPLIPPGDHVEMTFEPGEEKKYMCCIHPWMRAVSR